MWNSLPENVVAAPSIKNRLDKLWNGYLYELEPLPIRRMQYFEECDEDERVGTDVHA